MGKKKIIVFATSFLDQLSTHPEGEGEPAKQLQQTAEACNVDLVFQCGRDPQEPLTPGELENTGAVIADLEKYPKELLEKSCKTGGGELELIARYGVGYDGVDIGAAKRYGVMVTNTPGANSLPTAEWTVSTLLDVAGRRLPHHTAAQAGKPKNGPSRLDISGKTLGVIGLGTIGKKVITLMGGFNLKILAVDPVQDEPWAAANNVVYTDIETLCRESDFISLHAAEKKQIIGGKELSLMKPTTVLVNCARGVLVDNPAAYEAVKTGTLRGYGLDEIWTYPDLPLDGLNVAVSPHVGSDTDQGKLNMQSGAAAAVIDYLKGNNPRNRIV